MVFDRESVEMRYPHEATLRAYDPPAVLDPVDATGAGRSRRP